MNFYQVGALGLVYNMLEFQAFSLKDQRVLIFLKKQFFTNFIASKPWIGTKKLVKTYKIAPLKISKGSGEVQESSSGLFRTPRGENFKKIDPLWWFFSSKTCIQVDVDATMAAYNIWFTKILEILNFSEQF